MPVEPEIGLTKQIVYDGKLFKVNLETVRLSDGRVRPREIVLHPGAVALVVVDGDGKLLLVRQYRRAADRALLEIPAGTREKDEEPEACARREIQEETGYKAGKIERLGGFYSAPGFCTEFLHCYLCTDLSDSRLQGDEDESMELVRLPVDEVLAAIASGEMCDAKSICGIMLWLNRGRGANGDSPSIRG
jgi:ADP-ribose pyrophosphatase